MQPVIRHDASVTATHEAAMTKRCPSRDDVGHGPVVRAVQHGVMKTADADNFEVDDFPLAHRALRIACVTETYPPEVNGVATTVARLVEGLRERDHEVQLVRPRQDRRDNDRGDE